MDGGKRHFNHHIEPVAAALARGTAPVVNG